MKQDRLEVLKMLAEGKITTEEAEMLLRALDEADVPEEETDIEDGKPKQEKDFVQEMTEMFQEVGREIEVEVGNAIKSVQRSDIGKIVDDVVDQVTSSVSEAVDSVSDIVDTTHAEVDEKGRGKQQLDVFKGTGIARIDAQGANGQIALEGSDRDEVTVRAWKQVRGRRGVAADFAEQVEVRAEQIGDELRIFTEHPPLPRGVNLSVRYAIETPREVDVNLRTANSGIEIGGISGAIDATTANGVINLEGDAGPVRVRTANGTIKAEIGLLTSDAEFSTANGTIGVEVRRCIGSVAASATNGTINLTLPADFAGQLDVEARRGRVHTDFPVPVVGRIKNQLKGEVGGGGEAIIKLRTVNGSIRLKRGEEA
ncbi:DUF4097 domain-containing protein [Candidatus Poribacteria bacterium]|nr:DUF4097 domain-containing protein [Candidatus Poribacteria bacterium]